MRTLTLFTLAALSASSLHAQAQAGSSEIRGFIVDANGSGIVDARVTATDSLRGLTRAVQSGANGDYWIGPLSPGTYQIKVEAPGFTTKIVESVAVHVGDTAALKVRLEPGAVSTQIFVTTDLPVVETQRTQQSTTIDSRRIAELPINRRNYLDFSLLAPGVVETNDIVDGNDFRVAQTPTSGLSFGGSNGRGNMMLIDGVENFSDSGGIRPGVSQAAVQEFQINRNSFSAEFGGTMGGVINIVTKGGSNDWHGELFGFLRHRALQARNYFDPTKSDFVRGQEGFSAGGPIRKDKLFFFGSLERLDRHETQFASLFWDPGIISNVTASQNQLLSYLDGSPSFKPLSAKLRSALIPNNYPGTVKLFTTNSGAFPFEGDNTQATLRLDRQWSARNTSFLRSSYSIATDQNAQVGALIGQNRGRTVASDDLALVANHIFIPAPGWVSETRAQFSRFNFAISPNDPFGPEINVTGYGVFGREIFQPFAVVERHYQLQENVNRTWKSHQIRFGVDVDAVRDAARHYSFGGGRFSFGEAIPLGSIINAAGADPTLAASLAKTLATAGRSDLIPNLSKPVTALQAFALGLPTFYQQGFGDALLVSWQPRIGTYLQDTFSPFRNLTLSLGLRHELELNPDPLLTNKANFAPRFGFAWTPKIDGKTVIRGGFGLYYTQINIQAFTLPLTLNGVAIQQEFIPITGNPGVINPKTRMPVTSADIYKTLSAQGVIGTRQIVRADLAQFGLFPGPNAPGRVLFGVTPDLKNPYGEQASLEIEHAFGPVAASIAYEYNRGVHLLRSLDRNLFYSGRLASGQPTFGFKDPTILQNNVLESTANSSYNAFIVQVSQRYRRHISFSAHYTFSKAIDEVTDYNSDFQPQDQLNPRADRALSSWDQRHRAVVNAVVEASGHPATGSRLLDAVVANWLFAPILAANSGRPFNVLAGYDNFGDNHPNTHRPYGLGRNTGRGPAYASFDARISRRFPLGKDGRRYIETIVEGFNLLNHTNFKTLNNTAGAVTLQQLPQPIVGQRAGTTMPFGFTSAFDPRQLQLGLKLNF